MAIGRHSTSGLSPVALSAVNRKVFQRCPHLMILAFYYFFVHQPKTMIFCKLG